MRVQIRSYKSDDFGCVNAFLGSMDRPATEEDAIYAEGRLREWLEGTNNEQLWVIPVRSKAVHECPPLVVSPFFQMTIDSDALSIENLAKLMAEAPYLFSEGVRIFINLGDEDWPVSEDVIQLVTSAMQSALESRGGEKGKVCMLVCHHALTLCIEKVPEDDE